MNQNSVKLYINNWKCHPQPRNWMIITTIEFSQATCYAYQSITYGTIHRTVIIPWKVPKCMRFSCTLWWDSFWLLLLTNDTEYDKEPLGNELLNTSRGSVLSCSGPVCPQFRCGLHQTEKCFRVIGVSFAGMTIEKWRRLVCYVLFAYSLWKGVSIGDYSHNKFTKCYHIKQCEIIMLIVI